MELGDFFSVETLPKELAQFLSYGHHTFSLPTEFVARFPSDLQRFELDQGRVYHTDLRWRNGQIKLWREFFDDGRGKGDHVCLCEVWANCGDDDHINYQLKGFRLCLASACEKKCSGSDIPEVAVLSDTDWSKLQGS
jgi:hypothetical protein